MCEHIACAPGCVPGVHGVRRQMWASECMHECLCQYACSCLGAWETSHTTLSSCVLWFCGTVRAGCTSLLWGVGWQGCSEPWEQQVSPKAMGSMALCLWGTCALQLGSPTARVLWSLGHKPCHAPEKGGCLPTTPGPCLHLLCPKPGLVLRAGSRSQTE